VGDNGSCGADAAHPAPEVAKRGRMVLGTARAELRCDGLGKSYFVVPDGSPRLGSKKFGNFTFAIAACSVGRRRPKGAGNDSVDGRGVGQIPAFELLDGHANVHKAVGRWLFARLGDD